MLKLLQRVAIIWYTWVGNKFLWKSELAFNSTLHMSRSKYFYINMCSELNIKDVASQIETNIPDPKIKYNGNVIGNRSKPDTDFFFRVFADDAL